MTNETKMASTKTRIAVVTGGSRGLGKSTVLALAERGVNSIFTFVAKSKDADEVISAVTKAGAKAVAFQLDSGNVGEFDNFVGRVRSTAKEWGSERIDYLNNPMQRMATLEDVANAAEYLASDLSAYVSGQHLLLSGGAPT